MNEYIELGVMNTLRVNRISEPGLYLICENEDEILLPNCYVTKEMNEGETIDVFVYTDSEDRLVSTTLSPYVQKNNFASVEVVDTALFGAFVDIGLPKDLLIPKNKQKTIFQVGDVKVIQMIEDEKTNRLIGTEKFKLPNISSSFVKNDTVEILIYARSPLGFKVIVNNTYEGLVFHNEVFEEIHIGDKKRAFVKHTRDDGKLDISLQKIGSKDESLNTDKILNILEQNNGILKFTYKSDADDIRKVFSMSKKVYKASLTKLINDKKIILENEHIKIYIPS